MFNRAIVLLVSRIIPIALVRLIAVFAALGASAWGLGALQQGVNAIFPPESGMALSVFNPRQLAVLAQILSREQIVILAKTPAVWLSLMAGIGVFIWAQAAVFLAISPGDGAESQEDKYRSLPSILVGAAALWIPMAVVQLLTGIAVLFGFVLLALPGVWLFIRLTFAPLLLVVEDNSAFDAFSRSAELVRGRWWAVFGRLSTAWIAVALAQWALRFVPVAGPMAANVILPPFFICCQFALLESLRSSKISEPSPIEPAA